MRHGSNGQVTLLGDIATVTRGPRSPATEAVIHDGKPAILVAARLKDGVQVDVWTHDARRAVDRFEATLPAALDAELVFDQSVYTANRLIEVAINMAIGIALVIAVLFLTLGARAAFVVALILPLVAFLTVATMKPHRACDPSDVCHRHDRRARHVGRRRDRHDRRDRQASVGGPDPVGRRRPIRAPSRRSALCLDRDNRPVVHADDLVARSRPAIFIGSVAIAVVIMVVWSFVVALSVTPAIGGWMLKAERNRSVLVERLGRRLVCPRVPLVAAIVLRQSAEIGDLGTSFAGPWFLKLSGIARTVLPRRRPQSVPYRD